MSRFTGGQGRQYGSSRLGMATALTAASTTVNLESGYAPATVSTFTRGAKIFEMSNHLGNVLATLTDRKLQHSSNGASRDYYEPDILTASDYYPFGMQMPGRGVAVAGCHEEIQDATELKASSNLDSGAVQNGLEVNHNGVRWSRMTTTSTITLYNQAIKLENGGGGSDGVVAYMPIAQVEPNTTYVMEFQITDKSSTITTFTCQTHTNSNDPYRVTTRKTGTGHHAIVFTTPAVMPTYVRLRITSNTTTAGTYFVVDNFTVRKFNVTSQTQQAATDFNAAVMSGVNVSADGLLWTPLNASTTSLGITGTTDKKLLVNCTNVNESRLTTEMPLAGGQEYIMRFSMGQDSANKRLLMEMYARTGGVWAITETRSMIYTGSGHYMINFTHPAGADALRINFLRSNNGQTYDGYNVPYTIDNFSISRLDTFATRTVTVCDPPAGAEKEGLYRYGFNGQEKDNEVHGGDGNSLSFKYRIHDSRIGRFLSVDPLTSQYPYNSPYAFAENNVIAFLELEGLELTWPRFYWPTFRWPTLTLPRIPTIPVPRAPQLPAVPVTPDGNLTPAYPNIPNNPLKFESAIDWTNPPSSPSELGEGWKDVTHPDNKSGSKEFVNEGTGEKIRWDPGKEGETGWEGKNHWHRYNPNNKDGGKKDFYLDKDGNPVTKGSNSSHIGASESFMSTIPGLIESTTKKISELKNERKKLTIFRTEDREKIKSVNSQIRKLQDYNDKLKEYREKMQKYQKEMKEFIDNCNCIG